MGEVITDGCGNSWEKFTHPSCELLIVRPGSATCYRYDFVPLEEVIESLGFGRQADGLQPWLNHNERAIT